MTKDETISILSKRKGDKHLTALDAVRTEINIKNVSELRCMDFMKYCGFRGMNKSFMPHFNSELHFFVFSADRGYRHYKPVTV